MEKQSSDLLKVFKSKGKIFLKPILILPYWTVIRGLSIDLAL